MSTPAASAVLKGSAAVPAGVKVTDRAGLAALGAAPADVAALISETFNEMIFAFGDVHCVREQQGGQGVLQLAERRLRQPVV